MSKKRPAPNTDWEPENNRDTLVDLTEEDLNEFDEGAATPPVPSDVLRAYERGRHDERIEIYKDLDHLQKLLEYRGFARAMHVVRQHMLNDGAHPKVADAIIQQLAKMAGVKLL